MFTEIDERLQRAIERRRRKQKLGAMLAEAERILRREELQETDHRKRLESERGDVQELEGLSLTGLFYSILGTKAERLDRERQEYLAAKLKHDNVVLAVEAARLDVQRLRTEWAPLADADSQYQRLIVEKEQWLKHNGDRRAAVLLDYSERLANLAADRQELQEALEAGYAARDALKGIRYELRSAERWGTWDRLGGGFIATGIKHSKIDEARALAESAQRHLEHFEEELADADRRLHVSLRDIGGLSKFADFYFDGLIADWVVQSKIQNAQSACQTALSQLYSVLEDCEIRLSEVEREIQAVDEERCQFIEQA